MGYVLYYVLVFSIIPTALYVSCKKGGIKCFNTVEHLQKNKNSLSLIIGILIYSVLLGVTYDTGVDYHFYHDFYKSEVRGVFDLWGSGREFGYRTLVSFLANIFDSHVAFFMLCAFFNAFVWVKVCRMYGAAASCIMIVWYVYMFQLSLNLYRQYMAMALLMFAFYVYFTNDSTKIKLTLRKYIIVVLLIILAFLFHTSSLIGASLIVACYCLKGVKINKWCVIALIIATTVSSRTLLNVFFNSMNSIVLMSQSVTGKGYEFEGILDSQWDESRMLYMLMLVHIIYVWYADKIFKNNNNHLKFLYITMCFAFIIMPLTHQEILLRIRIYLMNIVTISVGVMIYYYFRNKNGLRHFPLFIAGIIDLSYFLYNLYNQGMAFPLEFRF